MGVKTVTAIVTRTAEYKDNDKILTLFTQELGRIDAKAAGCRRQKSPLLPAAQPFVFGEFELFYYKGRYSVNQCDIKETFYPLREDAVRFCAGSSMLALTQYAVQEQEPNITLFSLLYYALSYLTYGEIDPADILICYVLRYLNAIGYCPSIVSCAVCHQDVRTHPDVRFLPRDGGVVCASCRPQARRVNRLSLEAMRRMLLMEDADMIKVKLPEKTRWEIWKLLQLNCYAALGAECKALGVMEQFSQMCAQMQTENLI